MLNQWLNIEESHTQKVWFLVSLGKLSNLAILSPYFQQGSNWCYQVVCFCFKKSLSLQGCMCKLLPSGALARKALRMENLHTLLQTGKERVLDTRLQKAKQTKRPLTAGPWRSSQTDGSLRMGLSLLLQTRDPPRAPSSPNEGLPGEESFGFCLYYFQRKMFAETQLWQQAPN